MDINAVAQSVQSQSSSADRAGASLADNFDTFLSLLTTQLQNQDPLEPLKTNEFTQQLVDFTGVEQSIATNKNLELLIQLSKAASAGSAVSYLGKTVVAEGDTTRLEGGEASWSYQLDRTAATTTLSVFNSDGKMVYEAAGETGKGTHDFTWNGKDANGKDLPPGDYRLEISARDGGGTGVVTRAQVSGTVSAVDFGGSVPTLTIDGRTVPLTAVQKIEEPAES